MSRALPVLSLALVMAAASSSLASDGVIEINQAKALAGAVNGDLALDPPGFPVTITQSGSYRLTGLLSVPDADTDGIVVTALRTTIDLGGFEIRGPNQKPTREAPCSAGGTGVGVRSNQAVTLRNGRVSGMGSAGILLLGAESRVESVIASQNCGSGIRIGSHGTVLDSEARLNAAPGIQTGSVARVRDSIADANLGSGIEVAQNVVVSGCVATGNSGTGIRADANSVVTSSIATGNSFGIEVSNGSALAYSTANGNVFDGATLVGGGNTVVYSTFRINGDRAIESSQSDGIGGNTLFGNTTPGIPAGVALHCNALTGVGSCPP